MSESKNDNDANDYTTGDYGSAETIPAVDPGYGDAGDLQGQEQRDQELPTDVDEGIVSPGSTATGSGAEAPDPAEHGTSEADVSDGSEQKQPPIDDGPTVNVAG